jgi:hypothetical protein
MLGFLERLHLRQHDLLTLALNAVGWVAAAILTMLQFQTLSPLHFLVAVVMIIAPTAASLLTTMRGNRARDVAEREKRRKLAGSVVEDACRIAIKSMSRCPEATGAVVFLPDESGGLQTAYAYNKRGKPDSNLQFEKYQGATGHAWGTGEQTIARLSEVPEDELAQKWKLSPEYIKLTEHLKIVVATPIWDWNDSERMVGVVSIDCEVPDEECGLTSPESTDEALQLAALLARILTLAELV